MEIIAEGLEFLYFPQCLVCGGRHVRFDERAGTLCCESCGQEWHEHLFVRVGLPDDTSYFEKRYIGYPSCESRNSGAWYVPEYDYIAHFRKQPEQGRYFIPLRWPESQLYLFPDGQDGSPEYLNEPIKDECGIEDFDENAVWVPLGNIKS